MLESTFCHLPGVGPATEEKMWRAGVRSWRDLLAGASAPVSLKKRLDLEAGVRESMARLEARDAAWFSERLPASEQWRLFPDFADEAAFLDIETTGLEDEDHITTIAVSHRGRVQTWVHGRDMDTFEEVLHGLRFLVSFNGRCFDGPFIERFFRTRIRAAHLDLRFVLSALGIKGGLKQVERFFRLDRGEAQGLDGAFAVLLWKEWVDLSDGEALETLLAYNVLDAVNLEELAAQACNLRLARLSCSLREPLRIPQAPANPFRVHHHVITRIFKKYPWIQHA